MSNCDYEFFHIVFSTKYRYPWLKKEFQKQCWGYMGGIVRTQGAFALQVGGMEDHVHLLVRIPISISRLQLIRTIKSSSTQWIRRNIPGCEGFKWQISHGTFTVGPAYLKNVEHYIENQIQRHKGVSYKKELLSMLTVCGESFDEKALWD